MKKKHIVWIVVAIVVITIISFTLSLFAPYGSSHVTDFKEGDIIFQVSKSRQSPLLKKVTMSKLTHCGIVIKKSNGFYVLETVRTLRLTPIKEFINRGAEKKYWVKRLKKNKDVKIKYSKFLGKKYDSSFKWKNDLYYCSELVYVIYKDQYGIELCKPKPIKNYSLVRFFPKTVKKRNININELAVAPVDVFQSKYLKSVK